MGRGTGCLVQGWTELGFLHLPGRIKGKQNQARGEGRGAVALGQAEAWGLFMPRMSGSGGTGGGDPVCGATEAAGSEKTEVRGTHELRSGRTWAEGASTDKFVFGVKLGVTPTLPRAGKQPELGVKRAFIEC